MYAQTDSTKHKRHADPRICKSKQVRLRGDKGCSRWREDDSPLDITLPSANHSPSTVNRKASEFVMGTARLSSTTHPCQSVYSRASFRVRARDHPSISSESLIEPIWQPTRPEQRVERKLTSPAQQQKEPHTPRDVDQERDRIPRSPERVQDGEEGFEDEVEEGVSGVLEGGVG